MKVLVTITPAVGMDGINQGIVVARMEGKELGNVEDWMDGKGYFVCYLFPAHDACVGCGVIVRGTGRCGLIQSEDAHVYFFLVIGGLSG